MSFFKSSVHMLLWRVLAIGIGLISAILLARFLGPEGRGELAIYVLSISMMALILQFGVPEALVYLLGAKRIDRNMLLSSVFFAFLLLVGVLAYPFWLILQYFFDFSATISSLLIVGTAITVLSTLTRHVFLADKKFNIYNLSLALEVGLNVVLVVGLWHSNLLTVENALIGYTIALSLALLVLVRPRAILSVWSSGKTLNFSVISKTFRRGSNYLFLGVSGFLIQRINFYFLSNMAGLKAVGHYSTANTFPVLFANIPQQLATVLYSHVANDGETEKTAQLTMLLVRLTLFGSALVLIPMTIFAETIVQLIFGKEFAGIGNAMIILSIGMVFSGSASLIFNALAGLGYQRFGRYMALVNIGLISILGLFLIPDMGLEGAAIAQMCSGLGGFILTIYLFSIKTNVKKRSLFWFSREEVDSLKSLITKVLS